MQNHAAFFLPWAGIEKTQIENLNLADVKAAEKMAKLYDEITKHNAVETDEQIHHLNVFFSRLLFCFFAEDTGVFEKGSFTNAIGSLSLGGAKDLHELLDRDPRCPEHETRVAHRLSVSPPGVRLRKRQALRAALERPEIYGQGSVDRP